MVNVASFVIKFPHSSVRVKVTVSAPVAPQSSLNPMLLFVTVAVPQTSEPEKLVSHAANSPLGSFVPSHSTVLSEGATVQTGSVVSSMVNVASFVIKFPHSSVRVKVTVSAPVAPQSSLNPMLLFVTVAVPQTSEPEKLVSHAANSPLGSFVPSHSTVLSEGATVQTGSVVSSMVNVASFVIKFPHSSVRVKVTVSAPVAPQSSLNPMLLFVTVAVPQTSEPEKLVSHAANSPLGSFVPSHSTVLSEGATVQTGSVVSSMVNVASFVIKFPHSSVRVKVTVSAPVAPQSSLNPMLLFVTVAVPQTSEPEKLVSHAANSPLGSFVPSHSTVLSEGATVQTGSVVSSMVNVASFVIKFPHSSVRVKVTVSAPVAPQSSLNPMLLFVTVAVPQTSEPEKLVSHAANSPLGSFVPSHSTVLSEGAKVQTGSVVSSMVNVASFVIKFPHSSVRVKVTVSAPVAPQSSLNPMLLFVTVAVPQTSEPEKLVSHAANSPLDHLFRRTQPFCQKELQSRQDQ